jgi:hypothetical protein
VVVLLSFDLIVVFKRGAASDCYSTGQQPRQARLSETKFYMIIFLIDRFQAGAIISEMCVEVLGSTRCVFMYCCVVMENYLQWADPSCMSKTNSVCIN